jgi:ABC-type oligopeptide transport system substrate-binding subunit
MKRVKMFFALAALLLMTVGVFAFKAKFVEQGVYYFVSGTTYTQIAGDPISPLTTSGTNNASIAGSTTRGLYTYETSTGNYVRLKVPF